MMFIAASPISIQTQPPPILDGRLKNNAADRSNNSTGVLRLQGHFLPVPFFASFSLRQSEQGLQRNGNVVRGLARETHRVERAQDKVPQQAGLLFRRKDAGALGVSDKLRPTQNIGAPELAGGGSGRVLRERRPEH